MNKMQLPVKEMVLQLLATNPDKFTKQQRLSMKGELKRFNSEDHYNTLKGVCRILGLKYKPVLIEMDGRYPETWVEVYRPI